MTDWKTRLALTAQRNRQEIVRAKLSRRDMVRFGLLAAGGGLAAKAGLSSRTFGQSAVPASPPAMPWAQPMPTLPVKAPVSPAAMVWGAPDGTTPVDRATRRVNHLLFAFDPAARAYGGRFPPRRFYELFAREAAWSFHPSYSPSTVWGFDGRVPGPTLRARYGEPVLVRFHNRLPSVRVAQDFGVAEITTHLHNAHTPSESDGNPVDYVGSINDPTPTNPRGFKDQHYPNAYAGFTALGGLGDPREALGSLWYHDHHIDYTAQNVYKGLYGCYTLFDDWDTGDESSGLRLPSGKYDVPIFFTDPLFDQDCKLVFDLFNLDGIVGDRFAANGAIQPFFEVDRRRYRFRLYAPGPSRWWEFALHDGTDYLPFWQISSDGNLLPQAVRVGGVRLAVGERADVVVDFGTTRASELYLVNRLEQVDGRGPTGRLLTPGQPLVKFLVGAAAPDASRDPADGRPFPLRELPDPDLGALLARVGRLPLRNFSFERRAGAWDIGGRLFDENFVAANPSQEAEEVWVLRNGGRDWSHPIHLHFEEVRILTIDDVPVRPNIQVAGSIPYARKDVIPLPGGAETRIFVRFRDMTGRYVMHCHNTVHEDHAMMLRFDVV